MGTLETHLKQTREHVTKEWLEEYLTLFLQSSFCRDGPVNVELETTRSGLTHIRKRADIKLAVVEYFDVERSDCSYEESKGNHDIDARGNTRHTGFQFFFYPRTQGVHCSNTWYERCHY